MDFVIADGKTTVRILPLVKFKNFDFNFVKDQHQFSLTDFLKKCPDYSGKIGFMGSGMGLHGYADMNLRSGKLDDYAKGQYAFEYRPMVKNTYDRKMSFKSGVEKVTKVLCGIALHNRLRFYGMSVELNLDDFSLPAIIRQKYPERCVINLLHGEQLLKIGDYLLPMYIVNIYCKERGLTQNDISFPNIFEIKMLYGDDLIPDIVRFG